MPSDRRLGVQLHDLIPLPFTREAVPTVDLAGGRVVADPPPGLDGGEDD